MSHLNPNPKDVSVQTWCPPFALCDNITLDRGLFLAGVCGFTGFLSAFFCRLDAFCIPISVLLDFVSCLAVSLKSLTWWVAISSAIPYLSCERPATSFSSPAIPASSSYSPNGEWPFPCLASTLPPFDPRSLTAFLSDIIGSRAFGAPLEVPPPVSLTQYMGRNIRMNRLEG